jgi:hypothetical protein
MGMDAEEPPEELPAVMFPEEEEPEPPPQALSNKKTERSKARIQAV